MVELSVDVPQLYDGQPGEVRQVHVIVGVVGDFEFMVSIGIKDRSSIIADPGCHSPALSPLRRISGELLHLCDV